ncbi:DNA-directed RNA polymerase, alpha subunit [Candidatus Symbiothrix dinenymphae]|nr:DNA-directed RNA polymerase, alpha subunit [Candidatus Symbiothrix dinenymphae]
MAILAFQRPDEVVMSEANNKFGKFEFRPLEPGFGMTIGNSLRRILLSSLEGFAITSIKIDGVDHEFAAVPGVLEDVTNIILNLKQVRLKQTVKDVESEKVALKISGMEEFKAGLIGKQMAGFEVLNPDFVIAHLGKSAVLKLELNIGKGRGYVPAEENITPDDVANQIAIDSIFTPIVNVKYTVEPFRVEQKTDYEKLVLEISTDGSIHPKEALQEAAHILIQHFKMISDDKISQTTVPDVPEGDFDDNLLHTRQLLNTVMTELGLSVRALNCLKSADVETLGGLVKYQRADLLKFRNFGKKSLTELDELLEHHHLSFGMDVAKYKLDKAK